MNVENLRLLWADGDILHGVIANADDSVLFGALATGRVAMAYRDDTCVYDVTCRVCEDVQSEGRYKCPVCHGTGVVERFPDRLIGHGSLWENQDGDLYSQDMDETADDLREWGNTLVRAVPPMNGESA